MSKQGRGRPKSNHNTVTINELIVEYLSTKKDNYDNEVSYFKIVDPAFRAKLKPLSSLNEEGLLKMPIWVTDKTEHILKVKSKFVNNSQDLVKNALHIINTHFEFYHMEDVGDGGVKGYYAKITKVTPSSPPPAGIEIEINNDN